MCNMSAAELVSAAGSVPLPDGRSLYATIAGLLTVLIPALASLGVAYLSRPPRPDAPPAEHRAYADSGARPRGSRGLGTWLLAAFSGAGLMLALLLVVYPNAFGDRSGAVTGTTNQAGAADPTTAAEVTPPASTSPAATPDAEQTPTPDAEPTIPPDAEPTITPEDQVEQFLGEWVSSIRTTRDPGALAQFWRFPGDWFNRKGLQDASELAAVLPALPPPGPRPCVRQLPEVESLELEGTQVSVTAKVRWESTEPEKQGVSTVMFEMERADDGQPFRLRKVSEPPKTPPACR
jgi:hypothetical protein